MAESGNGWFKSLQAGIRTFSDFDSRGIGMLATADGGGKYEMIGVPTPAWIPDSFLRSMKRNLYYKMVNCGSYYGFSDIKGSNGEKGMSSTSNANSRHVDITSSKGLNMQQGLDFYQEGSQNPLESLGQSVLSSIVSTAANQVMSITSKVDSVVSGVSSLFTKETKQSAYEQMTTMSRDPFLASQPYVDIKGIHLAEGVRDTWYVISTALKGLGNAWSALFAEKPPVDLNVVWKEWNNELLDALKKLQILPPGAASGGDLWQVLASTLVKPEYRMHNFAEAQLLSSVSGFYTLTCKMPYFGHGNNRAAILKSSGAGAFQTGWGLSKTSGAESMLQLFRDTGINVVWNDPIRWFPNRISNDAFAPLNCSFHIYNDTLEHVFTNLAFIWSFGATTQSVTDYIMLRPPYLYDIEIPGGMRYKYCKCDFQVTAGGKMRKLTSNNTDPRNPNPNDLAICKMFKAISGIDVNPKALEYVPDYYTVECIFEPLLPNTWNFIDSYLRNSETKSTTGTELRHMLAKAVKSFQ